MRASPYVWHRRTHRGSIARIARESYLRPGLVGESVATQITAVSCTHAVLFDPASLLSALTALDDLGRWPDPPAVLLCRSVVESLAVLGDGVQWARARRLWMKAIESSECRFIAIENVFDSLVWRQRRPGQSQADSTRENIESVRVMLERLVPDIPVIIVDDIAAYLSEWQHDDEMVRSALVAVQSSQIRPTRADLFPEHWSLDRMTAALAKGAALRGRVKVSRNRRDCIVHTNRGGVMVSHAKMNRAMDGDVVVVELADSTDDPIADVVDESVDDEEFSEEEEGRSSEAEDEDVVSPVGVVGQGRVVGIWSRSWRPYVGSVKPENEDERRVLFIPMNRKIPQIRIFSRRPAELIGQRLIVMVDAWDRSSRFPTGHVVRYLGTSGDVDVETMAILNEHGIEQEPYVAEQWKDELPSAHEWHVTADDERERRDLRQSHVICSIDPPGCVDIDDALSVRMLPGGRTEFGVHIADVSAFVKPDSRLDLEARRRSTTVYLVDRRINMLPEVLSENLCSLHAGVDRLAVSVLWIMNSDGTVESNPWFGRTIIRSRYALSYAEAQSIVDGKPLPEARKSGQTEMLEPLKALLGFGRRLRADRMRAGALEIESFEVRYDVKAERSDIALEGPEDLEFHEIVAEFMIAANSAVAEHIWEAFPGHALLRVHRSPDEERFNDLQRLVAAAGGHLDPSSNKSVAESLHQLASRRRDDPIVAKIVKSLTARVLTEAQYCCAAGMSREDFRHYGLAVDFYTHFTSPIRRYADIIVHRLLLDSLSQNNSRTCLMEPSVLVPLCEHINERNRSAKLAQRDSADLFWSLFITRRGCVVSEAIVIGFTTMGLNVFIPEFFRKASVAVIDREGHARIALLSLPTSPPPVCTIDLTPNQNSVELGVGNHRCIVRLFDRVEVQIAPVTLVSRIATPRIELVWRLGEGQCTPVVTKPVNRSVGTPRVDVYQEPVRRREPRQAKPRPTLHDLIQQFEQGLTTAETSGPPEDRQIVPPVARCGNRMRWQSPVAVKPPVPS
ncbi:DIS3-like exonuclease 1 [Plasmodiophora brassicae]